MTTVTLHLRGGGHLRADVEDVLTLVRSWSNAVSVSSVPLALHYTDPVDGHELLRYVRLFDVVAIEYEMEGA